jgi:hypothetical protein
VSNLRAPRNRRPARRDCTSADTLNTIRVLMREREQWERTLGIKRDDDEKPKPTLTLQ